MIEMDKEIQRECPFCEHSDGEMDLFVEYDAIEEVFFIVCNNCTTSFVPNYPHCESGENVKKWWNSRG